MLTKLIRHEFRATSRIMWPIFAGMLALTLAMLNLPMRFVCGRPDCHAAAELKAWNEEGKVWREEPEGEGTYRPFEGLDVLMKKEPPKQ